VDPAPFIHLFRYHPDGPRRIRACS
jgi:hypothetical protein